jgi:hypothetical protein
LTIGWLVPETMGTWSGMTTGTVGGGSAAVVAWRGDLNDPPGGTPPNASADEAPRNEAPPNGGTLKGSADDAPLKELPTGGPAPLKGGCVGGSRIEPPASTATAFLAALGGFIGRAAVEPKSPAIRAAGAGGPGIIGVLDA